MLPAYTLGNWWSRYYKYTQQEYLDLMDRFKEEDIPFSVAVIDMDWHTVQIPEELKVSDPQHSNGWTGFSWNKELFPDYKLFLKSLHDRNLKTVTDVNNFLTEIKQKKKNIKQLEKKTNYNNYEQRNYDDLDNLYANKKL